MNVSDAVYEAVLRSAARGVVPSERVNARALWKACDGDGYAALEAALAWQRARAAVMPVFAAARAQLRAAA